MVSESNSFKAVSVNEVNKGRGMLVSPSAQKVIDFINNELPQGLVISMNNLCKHLNITTGGLRYCMKRSLSNFYKKSNVDRSLYFGRPEDIKKIK